MVPSLIPILVTRVSNDLSVRTVLSRLSEATCQSGRVSHVLSSWFVWQINNTPRFICLGLLINQLESA